jgi:hypothetical protein
MMTETVKTSFRIPSLYREIQTLDILYIKKMLKMFSTVCTVTQRDMNFETATAQQHKEKLICVELK